MKQSLLTALFTLVLCGNANAQTTVTVDTSSYVPIVTVSDDSFAGMCQSLQKKLSGQSVSGIVTFFPKVLPMAQADRYGSIWILRDMGPSVEFARSELPEVLQRLHGELAHNVRQISCYTQNMMYFGQRDVVILTASDTDAHALAKVLRTP